MDEELKSRLDRIDKKLTLLLQAQKKETKTWVKAPIIMNLTGWNREKLRQMRMNGIVIHKKVDGKVFHLLESVHPLLLKK